MTGFVAFSYQSPRSAQDQGGQAAAVSGLATVAGVDDDNTAPSVDEIIATDVAASLSERANLPIASNAANMAVSLSAKSEIAQADDTVIAKPQIIQPTASDRSVSTHVVKRGDTAPSVAKQYNISADTLRWANNLQGDALEPGRKLRILPIDGVEHTFKGNDSVAALASKYKTSEDRIVSYNDLELAKPTSGQRLIIPGGVLPTRDRPGYVAPSTNRNQSYGGDLGGSVVNSSLLRATAGNRYAYGNCTWYAYERRAQLGRPVGSFWGNASTWAMNARAAGYKVNNTPAAGAVLVDTAGYYGHVGVVESVKSNGDIVITEMNNYAYGGYGIVNNRTISAGQARAYQYVH